MQIDFQTEAVKELLEKAIDPKESKTIIFKSPTGSGKTYMMIDFIGQYLDTINNQVAFIWLCPGKGDLEEQSRQQMLEFAPNRIVHTLFDSLSNGFIAGSTTFINWEMVTKEGNKAITENEQKNLFDRIYEARRRDIQFIIIVDEEHSNNTTKAQAIIDAFAPINKIRVSATAHKIETCGYVEIDEQKVIDEEIIAKAIYVNEDMTDGLHLENETEFLIKKGDEVRKRVKEEYKKLGVDINPLVIIQLANGKDAKKEPAEKVLSDMGYTYDNGMVGVWLSDEKRNTDKLKELNDEVCFLIMKQAISTGWDCPRAKILVKLREAGGEDFEIQTIGRIRRMPERHHYHNEVLDNCYVFTMDEQYKAGLFGQVERAYSIARLFLKKDDEIRNFKLMKENREENYETIGTREVCEKFIATLKEKLSLTNDFNDNKIKFEANGYEIGNEVKNETLAGKFIKTMDTENPNDNQRIKIGVIANTHIHGIDLLHSAFEIHKTTYVSYDETRSILENVFCHNGNKKYRLLDLLLPEFYAFIINNEHLIKEVFRGINAEVIPQQIIPQGNKKEWKIPEQDLFKYDSKGRNTSLYTKNVYENYNGQNVTDVGKIRSTSEILFEKYCETAKDVKWVYKNGDKGDEYFSVVYFNWSKKQKLFYPDYILLMNDGSYMIIETKGGETNGRDKNVDKDVKNKFIAFKNYANEHNIKWGFVRDKSGDLYINNTEYIDDMNDDKWRPIQEEIL